MKCMHFKLNTCISSEMCAFLHLKMVLKEVNGLERSHLVGGLERSHFTDDLERRMANFLFVIV